MLSYFRFYRNRTFMHSRWPIIIYTLYRSYLYFSIWYLPIWYLLYQNREKIRINEINIFYDRLPINIGGFLSRTHIV